MSLSWSCSVLNAVVPTPYPCAWWACHDSAQLLSAVVPTSLPIRMMGLSWSWACHDPAQCSIAQCSGSTTLPMRMIDLSWCCSVLHLRAQCSTVQLLSAVVWMSFPYLCLWWICPRSWNVSSVLFHFHCEWRMPALWSTHQLTHTSANWSMFDHLQGLWTLSVFVFSTYAFCFLRTSSFPSNVCGYRFLLMFVVFSLWIESSLLRTFTVCCHIKDQMFLSMCAFWLEILAGCGCPSFNIWTKCTCWFVSVYFVCKNYTYSFEDVMCACVLKRPTLNQNKCVMCVVCSGSDCEFVLSQMCSQHHMIIFWIEMNWPVEL